MNPEQQRQNELGSLLAQTKGPSTSPAQPALEQASHAVVDDQTNQHDNPDANSSPRAPWWMYLIVGPFLAHAVFSTAFCFFGPEPIGIEVKASNTHPVVSGVIPDSPAERAGIQPGDFLVRANNRSIRDANYWYWFRGNVETGRPIVLETERRGQLLRTVLVLKPRPGQYWLTGAGMVLLLSVCGQFTALAVACFIAFLRPGHLVAYMGALLLAVGSTVVLIPFDGFDSMWRQWPFWYQVLLWGANILNSLGFGVCFTFLALFPRPSFHSKWIWGLVWTPILVLACVWNYQIWHFIYSPENMIRSEWMSGVLAAYWISYLPGSFAMLAIKYRRLKDETEKRRVRVFVVSLAFAVALLSLCLCTASPITRQAPERRYYRLCPYGPWRRLRA